MNLYDAFISYKSNRKSWVLTLARNLKTAKFSIFVDDWGLIPGQSIAEHLSEGLNNSRKGILVVTPEAMESGWVKAEYFTMFHRGCREKHFSVIPILLSGEMPQVPFLDDISCIDFRDPCKYREAFYRLCCALRDEVPGVAGMGNSMNIELEIPEPALPIASGGEIGENVFIKNIFALFEHKRAVLLLVQEDRWQAGLNTKLHEFAIDRFGEMNVLRVVPPFGAHENLKNYFSLIAVQAGFEKGIRSAGQLRAKIENILKDGKKDGKTFFLFLSGFENSFEQGQLALAGMLRGLNEQYPKSFKVLICGGEKLADMYYSGILSYLNHADINEWPDFTIEDVGRFAGNKKAPVPIDDAAAQKLLQWSGGHPLILDMCINLYMENKNFTIEDLEMKAFQSPQVWQLFTPFMSGDAKIQQDLYDFLQREDVAPAQPYIFNSLLKRLYWKNLLRRSPDRNRLYWRCSILRKVGLHILGNR